MTQSPNRNDNSKLKRHFVSDSATPWIVACQAPLSMEFSRPEYWSRLPFPSPGDHHDPGIKPGSPTLQADSLLSEPPEKPPNMLVAHLCPTLCDPMEFSPPDSSLHGILQEEYWSGQPFPFLGGLPNAGIELRSLTLQANSLPSQPWYYSLLMA